MKGASVRMKHFIDAIKGRRLSWTAAYEINQTLGTEYSGDVKLGVSDRYRLQAIVTKMEERGVRPVQSLLSAHQRAALKRKNKCV